MRFWELLSTRTLKLYFLSNKKGWGNSEKRGDAARSLDNALSTVTGEDYY